MATSTALCFTTETLVAGWGHRACSEFPLLAHRQGAQRVTQDGHLRGWRWRANPAHARNVFDGVAQLRQGRRCRLDSDDTRRRARCVP